MPVDELERDEKLSKQPHGLRLIHRLPLLQVRLQVAAVAVLHHNRDLHHERSSELWRGAGCYEFKCNPHRELAVRRWLAETLERLD